MNEELSKVDQIPDDERFLAPFREKLYTRVGRPTIPLATYLRMMYLKRRYKPGYETPVKEVSDSFMWRRFCHLSLARKVKKICLRVSRLFKGGAGRSHTGPAKAQQQLIEIAKEVIVGGWEVITEIEELGGK